MPVPVEALRVSADHRSLETSNGTAFFWLGDTAWNLLYRFTDLEITHYLETRRAQGFNVLQVMFMSEQDALSGTLEGLTPFLNRDVTRPDEAFWSRAERILRYASSHGFYLALLPLWGEFVANSPTEFQSTPLFDADKALAYGRWLGSRFADWTNIVWVLGGDRPAIHRGGNDLPVYRALSAGLREFMPDTLQTFHPRGDGTGESALPLRDEPWVDIIMYQSGHVARDTPIWDWVTRDLKFRKPMLDGEPCYEDHGVNPWDDGFPARASFFRDADVRSSVYRGLLAGACGVTYGHHAVWQGYDPARHEKPISFADRDWRNGLTRPAAWQMHLVRGLMERFRDRVPDQSLLHNNPNGGALHARAARAEDGRYALVYTPPGTSRLELNLEGLAGSGWQATWWSPRDGLSHGSSYVTTRQLMLSTLSFEDWVLLLDSRLCGANGDFDVNPGS
jgi:hypothetical protein